MNQDIKQLKAQSHSLKPVVIIGNNGLTEAVHQEIECALEAHELIKIKINANDKAERQVMVDAICNTNQAVCVNQIGHIATFYRKKNENS